MSNTAVKRLILISIIVALTVEHSETCDCGKRAHVCSSECAPIIGHSSWQDSMGWGGMPSRANDGNANQQWGGGSCSHTAIGDSHWWAVDFRVEVMFTNVRIYNRLDCCTDRLNHLTIYTSHSDYFDEHAPMKNMVECAKWSTGGSSPSIVDIWPKRPCTGRFAMIYSQNPGNYLTLCEVEFCSRYNAHPVLNIEDFTVISVIGNKAWQDSIGWGGNPTRANDGNHNQQWGGASCSHTAVGNSHWWAVEFDEVSTFVAIRIYNRLDCCTDRLNHLTIYTSKNQQFDVSKPMSNMIECAKWSTGGSPPGIVDIWPDKPCTGKYALIEMKNPGNYLTLCEVEFRN